MPYIEPKKREELAAGRPPKSIGELTYLLYILAQEYVSAFPPQFAVYNAVLGAFESASREFYRHVVVPYEDQKKAENGDVI